MDQNSSNGTDKRSWRERLGIGAGKDMPRIADEFTPEAPPVAARPATVKPAPMAPRPGVKAAPPRGAAAAAPSSASGEKLAEKLKAQREAQERLAEQRVQAARQRAEVKIPENGAASNGNGNGAGKPKFTFAGEEPEAPKPAAAAPPPRAPAPPPPLPPSVPPMSQVTPPIAKPQGRNVTPPPPLTPASMTPPRSPLGADRPIMPPRTPAPMPPPVMPTRPQSRYTPPASSGFGAPPSYGSSVPPYRPLDPQARGGYGGGGYQPPPAYTPPPVGGYGQPRLNVPTTPMPSGYGADSYDARARTMRPPPRPAVGGYRNEDFAESDVFAEARPPRRATAGDYSQAYRDEQGYDEELPPSRGPLLPLILLFLLALGAGLGLWWVYQNSLSKPATGQSGNAPVVQAPAQPAKLAPEPAPQQNAPAKKLIYDRIVGDREVLGGDVIQSEEVPAQPGDSTNLQGADPAAAQDGSVQGGDAVPAQPAGQEELVPLPLPPPPGDGGANDQQGSLSPGKSSNPILNDTAAGASQAAEPSLAGSTKTDQEGIISAQKSDSVAIAAPPASPPQDGSSNGPQDTALLPVPAEPSDSTASTAASDNTGSAAPVAATADSAGTENIADPTPAPVEKKKVASADAKKPVKKPVKTAAKNLGSKPVVLVPPAEPVDEIPLEQDVASVSGTTGATTASGGIYGGDGIVEGTAPAAAPAPAPVKKKRTIADLFRNEQADEPAIDSAGGQPVQQPQQQAAVTPRPVQPAPVPKPAPQPVPQQQVASVASGYVVQLASFANQSDANKEYGRLKAKHGSTLSGLSPIVSQAVVGGSTRYRLAVGVMQSREQASAVCSKLFAAGERDCLVRRQ